MKANDIIKVAVAYYKDKVQSETLNRFHSEFNELLDAEICARREKAKITVMQIAQLRIALTQLEITYKTIQSQVGECEAVDNYIRTINDEIRKLSDQKNKHKYE